MTKPEIIDRSATILVARFTGDRRYVVTFAAGNIQACTCPGFQFRGVCKHGEAVRLLARDLGMVAA